MIEVRDLAKSFGTKDVLRGLTLDVPDGQNTVVIGYSGTGKSVLLKCIIGLLQPDAGTVTLDGQVVSDLEPEDLALLREKVGYVFQFAALFDSMTVAQNIRLGLARRKLDEATIADRIRESLEVVQLEDAEDRFPAELSGGMRKRVGLARAIALKPKYLLYDEPTTGLDPVTSASMNQLMCRTRDLGVTGVIVTHDMQSAFVAGDRVAMLYDGGIRQVGTVEQMRASDDPVVSQFIDGRPDAPAPRRTRQ
jgi:phospholipid/cholesterol/gamma-HCH transport system ATP-binding protein